MKILAIDAALLRAGVAVVDGGAAVEKIFVAGRPGLIETLPVAMRDVLAKAGPVDAVAVTVGPGSFTGLRTAIALAQGFAAAAGVPAHASPASATSAATIVMVNRW